MLETIYLLIAWIWAGTLISYVMQLIAFSGVCFMRRPRGITNVFWFIPFWIDDNPARPSFRPFFWWYRLTNIVVTISFLAVFWLWLLSGGTTGDSSSFDVPQWNFYGHWLKIVLLFAANLIVRVGIWFRLRDKERAAYRPLFSQKRI